VELVKKRGSQNTKNPQKQAYGTTFMSWLRSGIMPLLSQILKRENKD
jgi:hypothetical protein